MLKNQERQEFFILCLRVVAVVGLNLFAVSPTNHTADRTHPAPHICPGIRTYLKYTEHSPLSSTKGTLSCTAGTIMDMSWSSTGWR